MGRVAASAVIVDLDGTVWDSFPFYAAALSTDLDGASGVHAQLRAAMPAATLLKQAGFTPARFRAHCENGARLSVYKGALWNLRRLYERGTPLGAVTNLPMWMVEPMLASVALERMFGSVVTAGRARPGKPHPAPILLCCRELDVEPDEDCWYVGDAPGDCKAALAAGVSFAWASWGYGRSQPRGAHRVLKRFSDIASL